MPEVALFPVKLSNVALRMAPRMRQNMQLETHKLKQFLGSRHYRLSRPLPQSGGGIPPPHTHPILSAPAAPLYCRAFGDQATPPNPNPGSPVHDGYTVPVISGGSDRGRQSSENVTGKHAVTVATVLQSHTISPFPLSVHNYSAPASASLAEGSKADCIQTCSPRVQVSSRVCTCLPHRRALSSGRCRGSSATPFQFIFVTDCQPHPTVYHR